MRDSSLRRSTRLTCSAICSGLGGGSRRSWLKICRTWGGVTAGVFSPQPAPLQRQEPQRHKCQGHVVVPAHPATHFVVPQAALAFPFLEPLLDPVPLAMPPPQGGPPLLPAGIADGVPRLRLGPQA